MSKFGFKKITPSNWLDPDKVLRGFVKMSSTRAQPLTADDYLRHILSPELIESVPKDVRALFEVARGAMIYGYFFYPLFTLAAEQLFRVSEAAVSHKCKALGAPKSKRKFIEKIEWLINNGIIPSSELIRWDAIRNLRNAASHPERQSILAPGNAIGLLEGISRQINSLFDSA
jgi:hypothetical protein